MNQTQKPFFLNRAASKKRSDHGEFPFDQFPLNGAALRKHVRTRIIVLSAVWTVAITAWCAGAVGSQIHEAAEMGNFGKGKASLLQDPKQIDTVDAKGRTVLARAALNGKKELVELLLNGGAEANARDDVNIPLLHQAVTRGKKEMVELLRASKVEINYKDPEGETALAEAAEQGQREIMDILIKHGGRMN